MQRSIWRTRKQSSVPLGVLLLRSEQPFIGRLYHHARDCLEQGLVSSEYKQARHGMRIRRTCLGEPRKEVERIEYVGVRPSDLANRTSAVTRPNRFLISVLPVWRSPSLMTSDLTLDVLEMSLRDSA